MPSFDSVVLRDLSALSDLRRVEQLQKEVWGVSDLEIFPALALTPVIEVGGVLIGAFDGARMIGFVFGFPGHDEGKLTLHSDMLAIHPDYRRFGLGFQLKLAQRERALAKGIETITWTFDPLQARNARLNFGKLGVLSNSYRPNYYGETTSFLHQSGTDRLWVTWDLKSERVRRRVAGECSDSSATQAPPLVAADADSQPIDGRTQGDTIAIEIPADINAINDSALKTRWREATRAAFLQALDARFVVKEFDFVGREGRNAGRYLLCRQRS